ncbi:hypothetical protein [Aquabacterium sp.]|uniref:hypothetical protein n=1 Tax=Aquabacterium sp. TaxID=1872578 RepID=UPI002BE06CF5|nr:hypothetical protein [Aquabacterium sp.]HSW08019.1 hypothetical protein [Aquabacterium sp.]
MNFAQALAAGIMAFAAATALAQPAPATPAASMPMMDCQKMAKHDHGAEKGTPTPKSTACVNATAASSARRKAPAHDHGKYTSSSES